MPPAPRALTLADAASQSPSLQGLMVRVRESQARLEVVRRMLPQALGEQVQAGALEEAQWCLLAPHGAGAAKLRQLLPLIARRLEREGFAPCELRIKVRSRG